MFKTSDFYRNNINFIGMHFLGKIRGRGTLSSQGNTQLGGTGLLHLATDALMQLCLQQGAIF